MTLKWPTWYKFKENKSLHGCSHFCWERHHWARSTLRIPRGRPKGGVPPRNARKLGDFPSCNSDGWTGTHHHVVQVKAFVIPLNPNPSHSLKVRFSNIWRTTENPSFHYESQSVLTEQAGILLPELILAYQKMNIIVPPTDPFHPFIKYSQNTRRDELRGKR